MNIADLQTLARYLADANSTSLTDANLLIFINKAYERITGKIITETGNSPWPYGDANYSSFPTYTQNLVNGQAAYEIDALTTPLTVMAVEVKDNAGKWYPLSPITLRSITDQGIAQSEYTPTSGKPLEYEKREHEIVLYPAPDNGVSVTLTAGLRIFFLRTADVFTSGQVSTGTKVPGFPSPWHDILAYEAALLYAMNFKKDRVAFLTIERDKRERELMKFMAMRNMDDRKTMKMKTINYI